MESLRNDLIIPDITIAFNISRAKTTQDLMAVLSKMYEKLSASNKIFLMKKFNLKIADNGRSLSISMNSLTSQLEYVEINFDDEIKALVLLSSLLEARNDHVTVLSNSCGT